MPESRKHRGRGFGWAGLPWGASGFLCAPVWSVLEALPWVSR